MNHFLKVFVWMAKIQACCKLDVTPTLDFPTVQLMERGLKQLSGLSYRAISQIHNIWLTLLRPGTAFLLLAMLSTYFRQAKSRPLWSQRRSKHNPIKINIQFNSVWSEQRAQVMLKENWLCRGQSRKKMSSSSWKEIKYMAEISEIWMLTRWLRFAVQLSGYSVHTTM